MLVLGRVIQMRVGPGLRLLSFVPVLLSLSIVAAVVGAPGVVVVLGLLATAGVVVAAIVRLFRAVEPELEQITELGARLSQRRPPPPHG